MRTDFSEFSYGYAITEELMQGAFAGLRIAPVFPSLIEEGRAGGGYDVKFDAPGQVLMLQFKRPDVMVRNTAEEINDGYESILGGTPFYRMHIRSHGTSRQHDLLLALDDGRTNVFYTSPCFHTVGELNTRYGLRHVTSGSLWIAPRDIGPLSREPHRVSYGKDIGAILYSDPRKLKAFRFQQLHKRLVQCVDGEEIILREGAINETLGRVRAILSDRGVRLEDSQIKFDDPRQSLASLADISTTYFGVQLFVVQREVAKT